eukprot:7561356-Pyramimonas_sp.AAC.1
MDDDDSEKNYRSQLDGDRKVNNRIHYVRAGRPKEPFSLLRTSLKLRSNEFRSFVRPLNSLVKTALTAIATSLDTKPHVDQGVRRTYISKEEVANYYHLTQEELSAPTLLRRNVRARAVVYIIAGETCLALISCDAAHMRRCVMRCDSRASSSRRVLFVAGVQEVGHHENQAQEAFEGVQNRALAEPPGTFGIGVQFVLVS